MPKYIITGQWMAATKDIKSIVSSFKLKIIYSTVSYCYWRMIPNGDKCKLKINKFNNYLPSEIKYDTNIRVENEDIKTKWYWW